MSSTERELALFATLKSIIQAESEQPISDYPMDVPLDALGLSSVQKIRIILRIERTFNIEIDEELAIELTTVRDIVNILNRG